MPSCFGTGVTGQVRILSCNVRRGTLHYQSMKISEVAFRNWRKLLCYLPNVANRVVMIEGFKVIFQGFPLTVIPFPMTRVVSTALRVLPSMAFEVYVSSIL